MPSRAYSYREYRNTSYFPALDGIRALSALAVISVHMTDNIERGLWRWLHGEGGVAVFFVLSGYLITTLALREEQERGSLSLKAFYIRRSLRIFPLYFYVLGLTLLLTFRDGKPERIEQLMSALPYYLTYMNEFAPKAPFYQSWSLGIEEKFYLLWPPIAFLALAGKRRGRIVFAAAMAATPLLQPLFGGRLEWFWVSYPRIMSGCLLALLLHDEACYERLRRFAAAGWPLLAVGLFGLFHFALAQAPLSLTPWLEFGYSLSIASVVLGVVAGRPFWSGLLAARPMQFLGKRSYGVYLIQMPCISVAEAVFGPGTQSLFIHVGGLIAACLVSIMAADVLYRVVERPTTQLGRKLSQKALEANAGPGEPALAGSREKALRPVELVMKRGAGSV